MALKNKKNTLADKINSLITAKPSFDSDDEHDDTTKAKIVERYEESDESDADLRQSKIRKQNVDLLDQLDKRYEGKKVSRKDIHDEDSEIDDATNGFKVTTSEYSDSSDGDGKDEEMETQETDSDGDMDTDNDELESGERSDDLNDESCSEDENEDEDKDEGDDGDEDEEDEDEEGDDYDIAKHAHQKPDETFKTMSETNVKADIEKGNCVRSQLKVWENLLEMRIKLQKCVVTSNRMPQHDAHKDYRTDTDFMKKTNETKSNLTSLLDKMLELQNALLKQYPETRKLGTTDKKRKLDKTDNDEEDENADNSMDEEIPSDTEDELESGKEDHETDSETEKTNSVKTAPHKKMKFSDYERVLKERHNAYRDYRNSVIQKWNDKTRIASGAANKGTSQTALRQIEFALSDKSKLRRKTQLKRSEYVVLGKPVIDEANDDGRRVQEYDTEIYDDDDFYHQLLRDLIEHKSSDVTDPIQLSKQWIQLQNMRRKMKRKIDTRATKGRRVRYNVHNKLVNFMAPINAFDTWTDVAKNELYNSLFGKIKSVEESH